MAEWEKTTLEKCTDILGDGLHGTPKYTDGGEYAFINGNNLVNGEILIKKDTKMVDYSQYEKYKKPLTNRTLLVSINGTLGNVGMYNSEKIILGKSACYFNVKEFVDKDFIYYVVSSPMFRQYLEHSATGTTIKNISLKQMREYEFLLPPIEKQKQISSVLKMIDEKIKNNRRVNENLLQQALAIYKAWFCDFVLSDGVLPESWHITTIDALSSLVTRGIAPKYDNSSNQIVLNQKCIRDHTIDVSLARRHLPKKINEKWVSKGDLLINSTGTGTLGRVAQVWFDANNMTVDSHVTIVRPKAPILQSYIGFWGLSHESEIEAQHTGSTGQTELPRDRVKAMELPLPDEDTLSKFNELVIPMTDAVVSNQKENAQLSQLRDTLLPKLMSGEIDVAELEL